MKSSLSRFVRSWLPVIVWITVIFLASGDLMSAEHTSRFLGPFLRWIVPEISAETIVQIQLFVRKCAHVIEYAILAMLLWRALRDQWRRQTATIQTAIAFLGAMTCAALDEFHQAHIASRTGSPADVALDGAGAIVGLILYWRLIRRPEIANRESKS